MSVDALRAELMDQSLDMPRRFRALFALRSVGGDASVSALLASLRDPSALFKHEVAFALGQMQATGAVETLKAMLRDESEHSMVRHEAAEALGAIASDACLEALETASEDASQVVRETATLALQRLRYAQASAGRSRRRPGGGAGGGGGRPDVLGSAKGSSPLVARTRAWMSPTAVHFRRPCLRRRRVQRARCGDAGGRWRACGIGTAPCSRFATAMTRARSRGPWGPCWPPPTARC